MTRRFWKNSYIASFVSICGHCGRIYCVLHLNIDQTLMNSLHSLLNCQIGGFYWSMLIYSRVSSQYSHAIQCIKWSNKSWIWSLVLATSVLSSSRLLKPSTVDKSMQTYKQNWLPCVFTWCQLLSDEKQKFQVNVLWWKRKVNIFIGWPCVWVL